jgi:hypothetical protein
MSNSLGRSRSFTAATQLKESGRADAVQGTAGITAATKGGVLLVRELGAILRVRYEIDPGLLAAFNERGTHRASATAQEE